MTQGSKSCGIGGRRRTRQRECVPFARAAVTSTTNLNNRTVLAHSSGARSPGSRHRQAWFLPRAVREDLAHTFVLVSGGLLVGFGVPWLVQTLHLCLHFPLHVVFFLSAYLCPHFFLGRQFYCFRGPTLHQYELFLMT